MPRGRKKKWKRAKLSKRTRPLQSLPINEDALACVLSFVSHKIPTVSKDFYNCYHLEKHDELLWKRTCLNLWKDKSEMAWKAFRDKPNTCWQHKMRLSIADSKRCSLTAEELCAMEFGMRTREVHNNDDPYWVFYGALLNQWTMRSMLSPVQEQILAQYPTLSEEDRFKFNPAAVSRIFLANGTIQIPNGVNDGMKYQPKNNDPYRWKLCKTRWINGSSTTAGGPFLSICDPENASWKERPTLCCARRTETWGWLIYNERGPMCTESYIRESSMVFCYPKSDMVKMHDVIQDGSRPYCSSSEEEMLDY